MVVGSDGRLRRRHDPQGQDHRPSRRRLHGRGRAQERGHTRQGRVRRRRLRRDRRHRRSTTRRPRNRGGTVQISKRKADRIRGWERIIENNQEGDVITGKVTRKIKGGLLVDIGVPVFLPASQVDIRRPGDIGEYIGQRRSAPRSSRSIEVRRNIVISRRKLIEEERAEAAKKAACPPSPKAT